MRLRELTEAWYESRLISGVDTEGRQYAGMPLVLEMRRGAVGVILQTFSEATPVGRRSLSFRLVPTSRFDSVRQEFEIDLEPMPCN